MVQHKYLITAYEPIYKPNLCNTHDLRGVAILDGNIRQEYIIAATYTDAVELFDKKFSTDGHLPNIQTTIIIY